MNTEIEQALTAWTVRSAIACYAVRALYDWQLPNKRQKAKLDQFVLVIWTIGCVLFLCHVFCAFAFFHDFSHANAYAHTAEQTRQTTGWDWGGGIYINYLFTVFWVVDVLICWRLKKSTVIGNTVYFWLLHIVFVFMIVNSTVVFGPPVWKPVFLVTLFFAVTSIIARKVKDVRNAHS